MSENTALRKGIVAQGAPADGSRTTCCSPLLSGPMFLPTLTAQRDREPDPQRVGLLDHLLRALPRRGRRRSPRTRPQTRRAASWYLRQMLGSANISGGPLFHILSGNLSHQIEHHLFPDLPARRYPRSRPR